MTDHSELIRAVSNAKKPLPEWLKAGNAVYSPSHGNGRVRLLMGNFACVLFDHGPVEFTDCLNSVTKGLLSAPPAKTRSAEANVDLDSITFPLYRELAEQWSEDLRHIEVQPPRGAIHVPVPDDLAAPLKLALAASGIQALFSHQVTAYRAVCDGRDIVQSTGVSSGKTLGFSLPVLQGALKHGHTTLIIVLSNQLMDDQFEKMSLLMEQTELDTLICGKIRGGVDTNDRIAMFRDEPSVLLINPDCLNGLISKIRHPSYQKFNQFLQRLRYVVIDEGHEAVGVLGAHLANMLMRLRLAISRVGGQPWSLQYLISSATVSNEAELADTLTQRNHPVQRPPLCLIDESQNGAPNPGRVSLIFNHQAGKSSTVTRVTEALLTDTNLTGITFFNSRNGSKKLMGALLSALKRRQQHDKLKMVRLFNSSVDQTLKRQVIAGIKDGTVRQVFSTSSLEAGIDMPQLDCSLVWGFPRLSSLRQRWGRAGRGKTPGLCLFIPGNSSLDYYYVKHPKALISGEVEAALLDPYYPVRLAQHLTAAAAESGLKAAEVSTFFGEEATVIVGELLKQGVLLLSRNQEFFYAKGKPYNDIPIRGNRPNAIRLINSQTGGSLEALSFHNAIREVFPGAIYKVQNASGKLEQFRSRGVQTATNTVQLDPIQAVTRFTQATEEATIDSQRLIGQKQLQLDGFGTLHLDLHWSRAETRVTGYQEWEAIAVLACETNGCKRRGQTSSSSKHGRCGECEQRLQLKQEKQDLLSTSEFEPEAVQINNLQCPVMTLTASDELTTSLRQWVRTQSQLVKKEHRERMPLSEQPLFETDPVLLAVHTFLHQLVIALPLGDRYSTQDVNDLIKASGEGIESHCLLMDTADGGTGATEYMFEHITKVAEHALKLSQECECGHAGCPRCLTHSSCLNDNEGLYKRLGVALLTAYLDTDQTEQAPQVVTSDADSDNHNEGGDWSDARVETVRTESSKVGNRAD